MIARLADARPTRTIPALPHETSHLGTLHREVREMRHFWLAGLPGIFPDEWVASVYSVASSGGRIRRRLRRASVSWDGCVSSSKRRSIRSRSNEQAKGRAETLFNELWSNRDVASYAAAQEVLAGRYTWLEDGIADPSGTGPMMPPLVEP